MIHTRPARAKREVSVQWLVEWAFRREKVSLDLEDRRPVDEGATGFGMEYVLLQRAQLGACIDASRVVDQRHEDAETVAALVAGVPDHLGGRGMAIRIAELAKAGATPDWMPDATPRLVPVEWRERPNGKLEGKAVILGWETDERWDAKHKRWRRREAEVRYTPCRWEPSQAAIAAARRDYAEWWAALHDLAERLRLSRMLRDHAVTSAMPPAQPWERKK